MARTLNLTTVRVRRARPGKLPQALGAQDGQRIAKIARENDVLEVMAHGQTIALVQAPGDVLWKAHGWTDEKAITQVVAAGIVVAQAAHDAGLTAVAEAA